MSTRPTEILHAPVLPAQQVEYSEMDEYDEYEAMMKIFQLRYSDPPYPEGGVCSQY